MARSNCHCTINKLCANGRTPLRTRSRASKVSRPRLRKSPITLRGAPIGHPTLNGCRRLGFRETLAGIRAMTQAPTAALGPLHVRVLADVRALAVPSR